MALARASSRRGNRTSPTSYALAPAKRPCSALEKCCGRMGIPRRNRGRLYKRWYPGGVYGPKGDRAAVDLKATAEIVLELAWRRDCIWDPQNCPRQARSYNAAAQRERQSGGCRPRIEKSGKRLWTVESQA